MSDDALTQPAVDQRTSERAYPLPHADNLLTDDVERLRAALTGIDRDIGDIDLYRLIGLDDLPLS